ncbi:unnamed protein product [Parnassius apollo]|uniref:(apollo) hypothetical protein n=1 Tax=Parnassius apollo TaxID=110799 RepID=A0A8S3XRC6_PARAO|nr:unnamed protein product [Parnassius apollo]
MINITSIGGGAPRLRGVRGWRPVRLRPPPSALAFAVQTGGHSFAESSDTHHVARVVSRCLSLVTSHLRDLSRCYARSFIHIF